MHPDTELLLQPDCLYLWVCQSGLHRIVRRDNVPNKAPCSYCGQKLIYSGEVALEPSDTEAAAYTRAIKMTRGHNFPASMKK